MDSSRRAADEFVRLFSLHTNSVYSYIHVLVPGHADAEDIFQETSRTLWEKFDEYQAKTGTGPICAEHPQGRSGKLAPSPFSRPGDEGGFRAWALAIARIEVLRFRQRQGRRRRLFGEQLYQSLEQATRTAVDAINPRLESLGDCYQKLPDDERLLIDARYHVGSSVEAIAAQLGRSVHSVYRTLRRIHEALFDCVRRAQGSDDLAQPKETQP